MAVARLRKLPAPPITRHSTRLPLARVLIENDTISPWQLFYAIHCEARWDATLPEILTARGWVSEQNMRQLLAERHDLRQINLKCTPPSRDVTALLAPEFCLQHNVLPWARLGETVILVTGRPQTIEALREELPHSLKTALFAVAGRQEIENYIAHHNRESLRERAETSVSEAESCRPRTPRSHLKTSGLVLTFGLLAFYVFQSSTQIRDVLLFWTLLTLLGAIFLRLAALYDTFMSLVERKAPPASVPLPPPEPLKTDIRPFSDKPRERLPRISVLVPLFQEPKIATALIRRLMQLTYPRALLEIVFVLEEDDRATQTAIAKTRLPRWMRIVQVPASPNITTKPRALNYALPFCRGDIVGVWDAEDAPANDQLEQVAAHFARAAPDVACLQGKLDYYNPYTNWLSRCFTIEYAAWFQLILPGLSRIGFAIPLGGTTLFFRRAILMKLGGWDSHNVTEDADLGIRLARQGYRTELLDSVTQEEANCSPVAWVRQRSRWLKGYAATYFVHMRHPHALWRFLGPRQFIGFQLLFLCSLSQFLLAPVLWLLWGAAFGLPSPFLNHISDDTQNVITAVLLLAMISNGLLWIIAIAKLKRPKLYKWMFTMPFYFSLATLAAFKATIETVIAPYYWDKTSHGTTVEGITTSHVGSNMK